MEESQKMWCDTGWVVSLCQRFPPPFPYPTLFPFFFDLKNIVLTTEKEALSSLEYYKRNDFKRLLCTFKTENLRTRFEVWDTYSQDNAFIWKVFEILILSKAFGTAKPLKLEHSSTIYTQVVIKIHSIP